MRPQSSNGILGYISGELLAGAPKEEHSYNPVRLPHPGGYLLPEDNTRPTASVVSKSDPFGETHRESGKKDADDVQHQVRDC